MQVYSLYGNTGGSGHPWGHHRVLSLVFQPSAKQNKKINDVCSCSHSELRFHNCLPKVIMQPLRVVQSSLNTLFIGMLFSFILLERGYFFFLFPFFSVTFCVFIPSEHRFDVMFVLRCKSACSVRGWLWVWVCKTMSSHENKSVSLYIFLSNNNLIL